MNDSRRFVGRRELDALLRELSAGRPVLVVGDAGVGKTRLAAEARRILREHGRLTFSSACLPMGTDLPLLPISDLLRSTNAADDGRLIASTLAACPQFVGEDVARVLPEIATTGRTGAAEPWMLTRLFAALVHFFRALGAQPVLLVIEDIHWADRITLDFLTYLLAHTAATSAGLMLTSRADHPRSDVDVQRWLTQIAPSTLTRLRLPPFSAGEVADFASTRYPTVSPQLVDELWSRAEGNAFFTEQLLTAAHNTPPPGLPEDLAALLRARVAGTSADERRILQLLAVARRPLRDDELMSGCALDTTALQVCLRALAEQYLTKAAPDGIQPRHALLGEAIVDDLPGPQRAQLHDLAATILGRRHDPPLAAEIARHRQHAGQPDLECDARIAEAAHAQHIGALREAAAAWQRAYDLTARAQLHTHSDLEAGDIALRGVAAWRAAGDSPRAETLAARALDATDTSTSCRAALRAHHAILGSTRDRRRAAEELDQAVTALELLPPTDDLVEAHHRLYSLHRGLGRRIQAMEHLDRAVHTARKLPPSGTSARALASLAFEQMRGGDVDGGQALLDTAEALTPPDDPFTQTSLADLVVYIHLQRSYLTQAETIGRDALAHATTHGLLASHAGTMLVVNLVGTLLAAGRVDDAGMIIDPLTGEPVTPDSRVRHMFRSSVDVHRGLLDAATERHLSIENLLVDPGPETGTEFARMRAELALWRDDPHTAAHIVDRTLPSLMGAEEPAATLNLLLTGMRACADLAEIAAARHDPTGIDDARTHASSLEHIADQAGPEFLREHPFFATRSALAAQWQSERARLHHHDTDDDWDQVHQAWRTLGWPHRAAYASWRLADVALRRGDRAVATTALRTAWPLADQHIPLRDHIRSLARRARIPLTGDPQGRPPTVEPPPRPAANPHGITARELDVLQLLAEGLTNGQIGARLYMSPKTASVHVSAILRKLGATNRAHAATIAERAGLIRPGDL